MNKLKFLISLTTDDNDYQQELANAAEQAARRFGVDIQIKTIPSFRASNCSMSSSRRDLVPMRSFLSQ
jgi:ABC-type sugar transport system substrate-binding protein